MYKRLICLIKGHQVLCSQVVTLFVDHTADLEHKHECIRCATSKTFDNEPLPAEYVSLLEKTIGEQDFPTYFDEGSPPHHNGLDRLN